MEKLLAILHSVNPSIDFENETALIDDDLIDSLDLITIVSEISGRFSVEIGVEDLIPENFNSVAAMLALIERK